MYKKVRDLGLTDDAIALTFGSILRESVQFGGPGPADIEMDNVRRLCIGRIGVDMSQFLQSLKIWFADDYTTCNADGLYSPIAVIKVFREEQKVPLFGLIDPFREIATTAVWMYEYKEVD